MHTSIPRLVAALIALAFVLAACASESGSGWTFAPTTASGDDAAQETPAEATEPEASTEPTEAAEPAEPTEPAEPAEPAEPEEPAAVEPTQAPAEPAEPATPADGEPRVIDLQADSALRFTDESGQPVPEIGVTPGETVVFRIDNTAGFPHNFWIGLDTELSVPAGSTDAGIADWSTGVQELEWVVPEDISDLKFACTVPGHYFTMQGAFALADEPAEAAELAEAVEPSETAGPATDAPADPTAAPAEPATPADGEPRVIELEADAAIRFLQEGEQIREIEVTPGETVVFRVDNTAGFPHNLYIGADDDLRVMGGTTDVGIPDWDNGVQELEWVVPEDLTDIRFACTVPGHYFTMQGDFTVTP